MILKMENLEFERRLSHQSRDEKGLAKTGGREGGGRAERAAERETQKRLARENAEIKKNLRGTGTYQGL